MGNKIGCLPVLSKAEWKVMLVFWQEGSMAAGEVFAVFQKDHNWAYRTLTTYLKRLVAKGALDYKRVGNSFLYRPVYSRSQMTRDETKRFSKRVLDRSTLPLVAQLLEEADLSDEEIDHLSGVLAKKEAAKSLSGKE